MANIGKDVLEIVAEAMLGIRAEIAVEAVMQARMGEVTGYNAEKFEKHAAEIGVKMIQVGKGDELHKILKV